MLNTILDVLLETFLDTLKALPVLYLVYLLVSYFEHNSNKYIKFFKSAKKYGPFVGATIGTIPQCGFSVAMADLYSKKNITLGTLIAVFITTSDEAIPIMLSNYDYIVPMLCMIAFKFAYAIICGYAIDVVLKLLHKNRENKMELIKVNNHHEECECGHEHHEHEEIKHSHCCADNIFLDALHHTLKISLFMFIISLVFALIITLTNFDITSLMTVNKFIQPLLTSLIGLIPNCAASVLLVETYMAGGITFASLLAGLCTSAGIGILMLFKQNKKQVYKNLSILAIVYCLGILLGEILSLINFNLFI